MGKRTPWRTRFYRLVNRQGPIMPKMKTRCWVWIGGCSNGYGMFSANTNGKRSVRAGKWLWESIYGPTPEDMELDHLCRNRACVRPSHLEPVTKKENWARSRPFRLIDGEDNPSATLTMAEVITIKTRWNVARGNHYTLNQSALAREYGVTPATIRNIIVGNTWKGVML